MGNDTSKIALDTDKYLTQSGYKKESVLGHSLMDKLMAGASLYRKEKEQLQEHESEYVMVKEKMSMNEPEYNRIREALRIRAEKRDDPNFETHLCRMYKKWDMVDNSWCTRYFKTITVTEYCPETLEFQLSSSRDVNRNHSYGKDFHEEEIWRIAYSITHGAHALNSAGLYHGDIQPSNIVFDYDQNTYKLMEKPLVLNYINGFNRVLLDHDYRAPLTPRELRSLKEGRMSLANPQAAQNLKISDGVAGYGQPEEIWGVGITLLSTATNMPLGAFYDWPNYQVRFDQIDKGFSLMRHKGYSEELAVFIADCLQKDPNMRPNLRNANDRASHAIQTQPWMSNTEERLSRPMQQWRQSHIQNNNNVQLSKSGITMENPVYAQQQQPQQGYQNQYQSTPYNQGYDQGYDQYTPEPVQQQWNTPAPQSHQESPQHDYGLIEDHANFMY